MIIIDKALQDRFLEAVKGLNLKFEVAEIAKETGIGEPTVSIYLNSKREVSRSFLRRFCEVYKLDFEYIVHGKKGNETELPQRQFTAEQLFAMFLEVSKAQTSILEAIKKDMARQDSQAIIEDKVRVVEERTKSMDSNLTRVLVGVITLSQDSEKSLELIRDFSSESKAHKKETSPDAGKRSGQTDGEGKKPRKRVE